VEAFTAKTATAKKTAKNGKKRLKNGKKRQITKKTFFRISCQKNGKKRQKPVLQWHKTFSHPVQFDHTK
jgi:hypothetical protein